MALPLSYAIAEDQRVHVTGPLDTRRMRRPGVVAHRARHSRVTTSAQGLPVVAPADTWVDLGELVGRGKPAGLDDLIVLGDAVAYDLNSIHPLHRALASRVRPRGKVTLLEALSEIRLGAASPRETVTRLMLVRCGLPEPELGQAVIDAAGHFLGVADLYWKEHGVVGEYQGEAFHASDEQRVADEERRMGFEREGEFAVEEIWKEDLGSPEARRACVLRFAAALGIPRRELDLSRAEPRFFSTQAMELAMQRGLIRRHRWAS
ncbi:hypothetical protein [Intrasporangium sp. YIM S08009]|uniref:hypothetical protein n=1 Tax=Intrasporangium zincisolvens TaxID=3080018 RepID=UPI002B05EA99|nr:hypothetical protein [Intrasporangium sp. YIM S08009]